MKASAKSGLIILGALVAFEGIAFFAAHADAEAIVAGRGPRFCYRVDSYLDGGTTVYHGVGYAVISPRGVAGVRDSRGNIVIGYARSAQVGITYWLPLWPVLKNRPPHAVYVPESKPGPNQAAEPTRTTVVPPAGAGDRASGARGSP